MRVFRGDALLKVTRICADNERAAEYAAVKLMQWEAGDRYEIERGEAAP